jgi:hypothetical protein
MLRDYLWKRDVRDGRGIQLPTLNTHCLPGSMSRWSQRIWFVSISIFKVIQALAAFRDRMRG